MNREYNDNKMYNSALDELRFSEEAKSRMVDRLMTAAEQPEQPVAIHRVRRFPRIAAVGVAAALVLSIGAGATSPRATHLPAYSVRQQTPKSSTRLAARSARAIPRTA